MQRLYKSAAEQCGRDMEGQVACVAVVLMSVAVGV